MEQDTLAYPSESNDLKQITKYCTRLEALSISLDWKAMAECNHRQLGRLAILCSIVCSFVYSDHTFSSKAALSLSIEHKKSF